MGKVRRTHLQQSQAGRGASPTACGTVRIGDRVIAHTWVEVYIPMFALDAGDWVPTEFLSDPLICIELDERRH